MSDVDDNEFESAMECYEIELQRLIENMREGDVTQSQQSQAYRAIKKAERVLELINGEIEYNADTF